MNRLGFALLILVCCAALLLLAAIPATAGVTERVSVSSSEEQGNCESGGDYGIIYYGISISTDGRYVVFGSDASSLVPDDTNESEDVFVRDRVLGTTERVSVSSSEQQGNDYSYEPSICADGRYVAFMSQATNLVPGDTNGTLDIFVRDRLLCTTERVSVSSSKRQGNDESVEPSISADGRYVAFMSQATNLVPGDTNGTWDIFIRDRVLGTTERVSVSTSGVQGGGGMPSISADGRYVAFHSLASNLVPNDTNVSYDIFVRDRVLGTTELISVSSSGAQGNNRSAYPSISADGRYVAFESYSASLVPDDTNESGDVFVRDRVLGTTECVSVSSSEEQGNWDSDSSSISSDGRYVAFCSRATNLVPGNTYGTWCVFVRDRVAGATECLVSSQHYESGSPPISADGRYVAFCSDAFNLVPGDTNYYSDVFVRDRWGTGTEPPDSSGPGWEPGTGTTLRIRNPYAGYTAVRHIKGQLHSHYFQDGPGWGVGSWTPTRLLQEYGALGYDFVCVTEHYHCTTDPNIVGPKFIRYCEEVTKDFAHVLAIGIERHGSSGNTSGPGGNEGRYYPNDPTAITNGLCEVEQYQSGNLQEVVDRIGEMGGIAIAAHPKGPASCWFTALDTKGLTGMSIYTSANNWPTLGGLIYDPLAVDDWEWLLNCGKNVSTPNGSMRIFCATEDDFTPRICYYAFGRTWIMVDSTTSQPTSSDIVNAIKQGRYWSYWSKSKHSGTGPLLSLSVAEQDGKQVVTVTSNTPLDHIRFIGRKKDIGSVTLKQGSGSSLSYTCDGSEKYVRVEADKGDIHIYSQAVSFDWQWSSGGSGGSDKGVRILAAPADLVLTCAQPEELPEVMPPLGYIGRSYFASTTSGNYPPDVTFTLSYQGQDVTPYGSSNLAIYRWDSASNSWLKLTSTVDIGNALMTAPFAQAGLYTISAQIIGDTTAPDVVIHTPSDGATLTGLDTIGVQATDNVGVLRASFYLNDQCIGVDSTSYDGFTCDYDFGKKSAGPYTLKVAAEDVTGNVGEAEIAVNISSSGVTPTVAITSPSNDANLMWTTTISGTCSDDALVTGVFIMVDGMPVGEASVNEGAWSYQLNPSEFADGPHSLSAMVMDEDQNTYEQGISVNIQGTNILNLSYAKTLPDGERARVSGRIVTLGEPGHEGAFYIEEADRFAGIRVEGSLLPTEGDMVSVSGLMTTLDGERSLVGADVLVLSSSNPVPPALGMTNLRLGGGSVGLLTPGITGGRGLNNIGLLVRVWGKVTQIGVGYLYIDDGSKLKDGTLTGEEENVGVRVICDPSGHNTGDFLTVTGISSCFETPSGQIARRIIVRNG